MARSFVNSILAVLLITAHSTTAFPSNIHEKMTRAERLAVFGSEDSVPEYQVYSMSLPGARRRRETDEAIKLKIDLDDKIINLTLKPTAGYLATKYTPVWLAKTDDRAYQKIRYDPLPTAMRDIGEFKMYHDVENEAAIAVYTDFAEGTIIEGIVTPTLAIRSLPKRLMGEPLRIGTHLMRKEYAKKRSITFDAGVDTGLFAVFKIPGVPNYVKPSGFVDPNNLRREKRVEDRGGKRKRPKAVYPEILLVLDHTATRNHTTTQALRFTLAFWNAADLIYRAFDKPKVRLNIAGIIIAADVRATPYMNLSSPSSDLDDAFIVSQMGKYFYKEKIRFPVTGYDMIIAMTTTDMCGIVDSLCYIVREFANRSTACSSKLELSRMKTIGSSGIVGYNFQFTGIIAAAQVSAKIFGAESEFSGSECTQEEGHVMARWKSFNWFFTWSHCSRRFFSQYFSSEKSKCLDNKPLWRKTVGKVLPGRWMSMDGQCRNEGFAKACTLKKKWMCKANGCRNKGSLKCTRTSVRPLPGSACGNNKHCSTKKKCVRDWWD